MTLKEKVPTKSDPTQQEEAQVLSDWQCRICRCRFISPASLRNHMRHHRKQPVQRKDEFLANNPAATDCWLCSAKFDTHAKLVEHAERHYQVGSAHACDFCALLLLDEQQWMEHVSEEHTREVEQTISLNKVTS